MMKFHHLISLLVSLWSGNALFSVDDFAHQDPLKGNPILKNYDIPLYRHKGEVWAFEEFGKEHLWIGSETLHLFDGKDLKNITLPLEIFTVRTLEHDSDGKLWIGSNTEIGHLERNHAGEWRYVSNKEQLLELGIDTIRVWDSSLTPDGLVFVGSNEIVRYKDNKFECWRYNNTLPLRGSFDGKSLWIINRSEGLYKMTKKGPELAYASEKIPHNQLPSWVIETDSTFMLGTTEAIFKASPSGWMKLERLSSIIKDLCPWRVESLGNNKFAIGTSLGGVIIGSSDDQLLEIINTTNGLPSDAVKALWYDQDNNKLWIGFNGGISRYELEGTTSFFERSSRQPTSEPIKTLIFDEQIWFVSPQELTRLVPRTSPEKRPEIEEIIKFPTPIADVLATKDYIWFSSYGGGIYSTQLNNNDFTMVAPGDISKIFSIPSSAFELIFFEDGELKAIKPRSHTNFEIVSLGIDLHATPNSIISTPEGELWVNTIEGGLFRIGYDPSKKFPDFSILDHFRLGEHLSNKLGHVNLSTLGNQIFLLTSIGVLKFNRNTHAFETTELTQQSVVPCLNSHGESTPIWMLKNPLLNLPGLVKVSYNEPQDQLDYIPLDVKGLDLPGKIQSLSYVETSLPSIWIAGPNGILRFSLKKSTTPSPPSPVILREVEVNGRRVDPVFDTNRFVIESGAKTVDFHVDGIQNASRDKYLLMYRLLGYSDEWTPSISDSTLTFTGLKAGKYTLEAKAVDKFARESELSQVFFRILPPWYHHPMAYACYLLIFLFIGFLILRFREIRLKLLNKKLNSLVEERTIELARANTASNEFLEVISHEVRNPLNGIANLVDLLHDTNLEPEAKRLASSLLRSTSHLKQVFGDILSFAKLEYGYVKMHQTPFELKEIMQDLIALYEFQAHEQNVNLALEISEKLKEWYVGDIDKIRTILKNFISNAVKYSPDGQVKVTVSGNLTEAFTHELIFSVKDSGPGIPEAEQDLIFNKFYRSESARKSSNVGTGLGLALCKTLSELIGGTLMLESKEQIGSNFVLTVSLQPSNRPAGTSKKYESVLVRLPPVKRALIVDDQEYNQEVLRGICMRLGYEAFVASNSDEVITIVNKRDFGVVFLDWELPRSLNGGEISFILRQHPNASHSVIIATTAHENDTIRQKCMESGMDSFALKPFNSARIKKIVEEAWMRRSGTEKPEMNSAAAPSEAGETSNEITLSAFSDYSFANPEHTKNAVVLYLTTLESEIGSLRQAIEVDDAELVARIAHRLRSHSGLVNGVALNLAAKRLMEAARDPDQGIWKEHTLAVFQEAECLVTRINELCQQ